MTGAESVLEKLDEIYLAAGLGKHVEVFVMDMDIAVDVSFGYILRKNVVIHEILSSLGSVFQHRSHRGIAVDVRVFSLDISILGIGISQFIINVHQIRFCFSDLCMLSTVENVSLGCLLIVVLDKHLLYDILYLLNCAGLSVELLNNLLGQIGKIDARHLLAVYSLVGSIYSVEDLGLVKYRFLSVSLYNSIHGLVLPRLMYFLISLS